jgi:hypothetical protein
MFALARTQRNGARLYLARDDDGDLIPTPLKSAAHAMTEMEAEGCAEAINQYTAEPYEVVGVRNEVE